MNPIRMILIFGAMLSLTAAALPHIVWLLGSLAAKMAGRHLRYAPFGYAALILIAAVILSLTYGYFLGRWKLKIKDIEYVNSELPPAFNGFRIVHISDLHLSTFNNHTEKLREIVDSINAQQPDLVCFTGDLVTLGRTEAQPHTAMLKDIKAKFGVVSVLGNHDFLIYDSRFETDDQRGKAVDDLADYVRNELGWILLRNSNMMLSSQDSCTIALVGVDNKNCIKQGYRTINAGDLPKAMQGASGFTILLTHDPSHWDYEVLPETSIPLTLSGHTHSAQVSLLGWSPASWMFKRAYGMYTEDEQSIYVNPGLGCTVPFRIGARPEITVITLKCR